MAKRTFIRHAQGVIHAITPNQGNPNVLKNAHQVLRRLTKEDPTDPVLFDGVIPDGETCELSLFTYDAKQNYGTGGEVQTWSLINPPTGMIIGSDGIIRWTPTIGTPDAINIQVSGDNVAGPAALSNAFDVAALDLPNLSNAVVDSAGTTLTLTFSEDTTGTSGFSLFANGSPVALSAPVDGASTITFTCEAIYAGQTVTLAYAAGDVVNAKGCALQDFTDVGVTNNSTVPLPVAPVYQSSNVDTVGTTLTVVYDSNIAGASGYTYRVNGGGATALTGGVVTGSGIAFTVPQVYDTDTVTLSYTPGDTVGDPNGLPAVGFSNQAVTNNSTVVVPVIPVYQSSSVDTDGTTFRINYDINVAGSTGFTFTRDGGGAETLTGGINTGTQVEFSVVSPIILQGETILLNYTAGNVVSVATGDPAADFSNQSTTNNSIQTGSSPPVFSGTIPDLNSVVNIPMDQYDASVHYQSGGAVTDYTLQNSPAWMSISSLGIISGTPDAEALTSGITVTGQNNDGSDVSNAFSMDAVDSLAAPIFDGVIPNQLSDLGVAMTPYDSSTHFTTGGPVSSYSLQNAPAWMSIHPTSGVITGTPDEAGVSVNITVTATNASGSDTSNAWQYNATPLVDSFSHIVLYGQSLSLGTDPNNLSREVVSPEDPNSRMFNGGIRAHADELGQININTLIKVDQMSSVVSLKEQVSGNGDFAETFASGIALRNPDTLGLFSSTARGAAKAVDLSKDAAVLSDLYHWANTCAAVQYASIRADDVGLGYKTLGMLWKQGEADGNDNTPKEEWKSRVEQIHLDTVNYFAAAALVDQSQVVMLIDQQAYGRIGFTYADLAVAAIEIHRETGGFARCLGPTYPEEFTAINDVHMTSVGYRKYGERIGHIINTYGLLAWNPCHITGVVRTGTTIDCSVYVPAPPLVFDETFCAPVDNKGFAYDAANITNVVITDDGTADNVGNIQITLDADITGTLGVGYNNGMDQRIGPTYGPRTNVRDSDPAVTLYDGASLANWLCNDQWVVT